MPFAGGPDDLEKAMRSVRIEPVLKRALPEMAKMVRRLAAVNLKAVPGSFSRSHAKLSLSKQGGVELEGGLAVVAEYGMSGRSWSNWHGGRVQRSPVPPPRFGSGRPGPEDGHVLGKAYRMLQEDLHEFAADVMWDEYQLQFDKGKIFKVRG